jgi:alkylation response protein AidB-like acyl-CoA dehydrogenase
VLDGDEWVLNGSKIFITSAPYAGVFVVWAVTHRDAPAGKGISCFLVESEAPGLVIGRAEEKMGQHASATNELLFENCRVPKDALMGKLNDGFRIAVGELAGGRIGIGSLALGLGLAAMDYATKYSLERVQFNQPISNFQAIQWKIADSYTELEAARLLLMNASFQKEQDKSFAREASMAKLFATEMSCRVADQAVQIHGGMGVTRGVKVERLYREARLPRIYEGASEIQKLVIYRALGDT